MIQIIITSFVGIFGVAAALNGFLFKKLAIVSRAAILVAGIMMMDPGLVTDLVGVAVFCAVCAWQFIASKKLNTAAAA